MSRLLARLVLVSIAAAGCGRGEAPPPGPEAPNLVLLVLDTLRPDHLNLYGYPRPTAPFLARLGARSAVFTAAFSTSSWTAPATASIFTGRYPLGHGVTLGMHAHRALAAEVAKRGRAHLALNRLPDGLATLPELLRARGYATFGISTNPNVGPELGFDRGFDRFERRSPGSAEEVATQLGRWKREIRASAPYLLYLHFNDVHAPYHSRSPWYRESGVAHADAVSAYDSEIRYLDGVLERILGEFDPDGESVVFVLSDHGEELWERGEVGHYFSLHAEVNRVLLLVHAPRLGVLARRLDHNVSLVDVLPTLLELVGASAPAEGDGRSLLPLLTAADGASALAEALERRALLAHRVDEKQPAREMWATVRGRWKLIESDGGQRLFDLRLDPEERADLADRRPAEARALARLSRELRGERARPAPAPTGVDIDAERLEQLRELGYAE